MRIILNISLILLCSGFLKAQTHSTCDSIRFHPDTAASYKQGARDIMDFVTHQVYPVLQECYVKEGRLISKLNVQLTIDTTGKVIAAYVLRPDLPLSCRNPICEAFLKMDSWKPAKQKGLHVCSDVWIPIACIKWQ